MPFKQQCKIKLPTIIYDLIQQISTLRLVCNRRAVTSSSNSNNNKLSAFCFKTFHFRFRGRCRVCWRTRHRRRWQQPKGIKLRKIISIGGAQTLRISNDVMLQAALSRISCKGIEYKMRPIINPRFRCSFPRIAFAIDRRRSRLLWYILINWITLITSTHADQSVCTNVFIINNNLYCKAQCYEETLLLRYEKDTLARYSRHLVRKNCIAANINGAILSHWIIAVCLPRFSVVRHFKLKGHNKILITTRQIKPKENIKHMKLKNKTKYTQQCFVLFVCVIRWNGLNNYEWWLDENNSIAIYLFALSDKSV